MNTLLKTIASFFLGYPGTLTNRGNERADRAQKKLFRHVYPIQKFHTLN